MSKAANRTLFFYQGDKLITVKEGDQHRAIFRNAEKPLAELSADDTHSSALLAIDQMSSVLVVQGSDKQP